MPVIAPESEKLPVYPLRPEHGVLVVNGYGLRLQVSRGHLVIESGIGGDRQHARFGRVDSGIRRLLVIGHSGSISLEALRWLHDIQAMFVQIDTTGELLMTSTPKRKDYIGVRRAQALAPITGLGLNIARDLIQQKVTQQSAVMEDFPDGQDVAQRLRDAIPAIQVVETIDELRILEAHAALAYWEAWQKLSVRFAGRDSRNIPEHWRVFSARRSGLANTAQNATTPINALLNYLYSILEAEAKIAALAVGCDPAIGIMHADLGYRDSLACDLMEPIRPAVDAYVLDLVRSRIFVKSDFFEHRDGRCRLMPDIAHPLAKTAMKWAALVAPIAESVAAEFAKAPRLLVGGTMTSERTTRRGALIPTMLSGRNRSRGKNAGVQNIRKASKMARIPKRCNGCGTNLQNSERKFCDPCFQQDHATRAKLPRNRTKPEFNAIAPVVDSALFVTTQQEQKLDSVQTFENVLKLWRNSRDRTLTPTQYWTSVKPKLRMLSTTVLVRTTDLTPLECLRVRKGQKIPPPKLWATLQELLETVSSEMQNQPINVMGSK